MTKSWELSFRLIIVVLSEIDPCVHYNLLNTSDRRSSYNGSSYSYYTCDYYQISNPKAWYRFGENAGSQMATGCVAVGHCGTQTPGWLNGSHPTQDQGIVSMNVCFNKNDNCCYFYKSILVRNCGLFYSYELVKPSYCHRYCGEWSFKQLLYSLLK